MNHETGFFTIVRGHLPMLFAAFLMALFAMSLATMIVLQQHVSDPEQDILYYFQAMFVLCIYLCSANLLVVRGRPWGVWLVVALMLVCILTVVLASGYRVPRAMFFLGLFCPLVALPASFASPDTIWRCNAACAETSTAPRKPTHTRSL